MKIQICYDDKKTMLQTCFTQKEIKLQESFGKILKEARLKRKKTLREIEEKTHIRMPYLKALEEENLSVLPPEVYTKGFISRYAQILQLNPKKLLPLYEKKYKNFKNQERRPTKKKPAKFNLPFFDTKKIKLIVISIVLLSLFLYLLYQFLSFINNPFLSLEEPPQDLKTSRPNVIFKGQTEKDAKVFINDQEIVTDEQGFFRENIVLQRGLNKIVIKVINKLNKEQEIVRNIFYEPEGTEKKSITEESILSSQVTKKEDKIELILEIKNNPTWISLSIDGKKVLEKTLSPSLQKFQVEEQFSIISGKAGNTYLKIANRDLGPLGPGEGVIQKTFQVKELLTK